MSVLAFSDPRAQAASQERIANRNRLALKLWQYQRRRTTDEEHAKLRNLCFAMSAIREFNRWCELGGAGTTEITLAAAGAMAYRLVREEKGFFMWMERELAQEAASAVGGQSS